MTLDYGVRYGLYPALKDDNNLLDTFDPTRYVAGQGADLRQRRVLGDRSRAPAIR